MEILAPRYADTAPVAAAAPRTGATLLLTDREDIAATAHALGVGCRYVDPGTADDARFSEELRQCDTLVVAWGDTASAGALTYEKSVRFARGCLALLRAVHDSGRRIHLVTLSHVDNVLSSLLDGMATSATQEFSLSHTAVEFSGSLTHERLGACLTTSTQYPGARLTIDGDRVTRRDYRPQELPTVRPAEVFGVDDNLVLIGGAGGVGRELCRYLSRGCGSRLFVLGRGTPDRAALAALKESGAKSYLSVPAHEPEALTEVFEYIRREFGPVRAVFNLAGALDDCLLPNLTAERLEGVLRPKVAVGLNLARLPESCRPEMVVHFSSLTSVTGNLGQVAYGAANAFLDRLTPRFPDWYSINWGLWDTDGMRMPDGESGLRAMRPQQACDALLSAIAARARSLVIFDGHISLGGDADPAPTELPTDHQAGPDLQARTAEWLRALVARHTGLKHLGDEDNLLDNGVDSAGSIRISRDIETQLDLGQSARLSRAVILEYPTIAALSAHLVENVGAQPASYLGSAVPAEEVTPAPVQERPVWTPALAEDPVVPVDAYRPDDIAIIGMAGEFPGGADIEEFWQSLLAGDDAVRVIPGDRWDWRENYSLSPDEPGTSYGRHGGFLDHALDFDPVFFSIMPVEAKSMDPQERRFLQCAYHALEDSGYFARPTRDVGVFLAAMYGHYQDMTAAEQVISSSFAAIANRVSYAFDFHGPSVALDTMCSGSLSALHLAVNGIRAGDCTLAVAGGVNIMTHPGKYRLLSEGKFLSPTGYCHSFGVEADGYVPGEGTGAVVLKRLSEAMRDGDRVHAVIRATAVNSGGRTAGFTVPSERAQQRVITSALSRAGIEPDAVTCVEAHGTGTELGDPIEVRALRSAYGDQGRAYLGTVKSNIGHLESAAAMAGLVKVVKQLTHRTLVPTLHCELENPHLNLDDSRFVLVKEAQPWPKGSGPTRFAGLSSFGAGGANGHAIIQEFVAPEGTRPDTPAFTRYFIPLSGRDDAALRRRKDDLLGALSATPEISLYGLSYTLCCARQHFRARSGYWVESVQQLTEQLQGSETGSTPPGDQDWATVVSSYLDGGNPDFARLFPVRMLVDAPLYPFAADRYLAAALDPRTTPATPPAASVLLTPVWRPRSVSAAGESPVRCVLALTDRDQDLPAPPGPVRMIRVVPGDTLVIEPDRITLPAEDETAIIHVLDHLTKDLDHLHWVNLRREWTVDSALTFAKALHSSRTPATILTATGDRDTPESRAITGFFNGLAHENPHIRAVQMYRSDGSWPPLLDELRAAREPVTEVRWADGTRSLRELAEIRLANLPRVRQGGTYLLTGGLGKVGQAIAEHLIDHYQATVVAVGRSAPNPAQQGWLATRQGLHYERADITAAGQTRDLVDRVTTYFGAPAGVIHSAGVVRDSLVQNKSTADAHAVLAPKVQGTRNLDDCTAHLDLDFFCVFSSISSVLGNVGQSDYIAANRFLDEFAAERARRVRVGERSGFTLSVNWPLWLDPEDERREQYQALAGYLRAKLGLEPLTSQRGASLFLDLLNGVPEDCHQVVACVGDVPTIRRHLVDRAPDTKDTPAPENTARPAVSLEDIGGRLVTLVGEQTGLTQADITVDDTWGDLGYGSVMLQKLALSLGPEFGVETPPNALFTYSTIKSLSGYLRHRGATTPDAGVTTEEPALGPGDETDGYAIVGMSGVLPGGRDLDEYWRLLIENRSAVRRVERWPDKDYVAGTIDGFDVFDNGFFGLSAREAMLMDPQHRLFLQAAYNALLDAGYAPSVLKDVGVFAGVQFNEYQSALQHSADWAHPYAVTGNAHTMLANRVSHLLDFTGPSQTIDTACSSGLVALNRGVLSLAAKECEVALVGAVSVLIDPAATDAATGLGVLSPDHRCATFDKDANGYVRAEGVGCVVVKRLADARRDGDTVLAVVKGVAENHDGRSNSLTAPNPEAQVALLEKVYTTELAAQVTNIETHGTGTGLGDPIEVGALRSAFQKLAPYREPGSITLGAVKTNVGHLEPAAGMAGLLKMVLCLRHRTLPANINFHELNPLIDLADSPFRLLVENEDWKDIGPLVTGISSFGFGGSNAHAVLSEAPAAPPAEHAARPYWLVALSARSASSLSAMLDALVEWLRGSEADLADIAYTLDVGRDHFEYRLCWIASDLADLRAQAEAARPDEVAKCARKRLTTHAVEVPEAGPGYRAALESVRDRYLDGEEFEWTTMFDGGRYRRLTMPGYAFEPNRFWFE